MKHTEVHGTTKTVVLIVKLTVKEDVDVLTAVSEMDYTFDFPGIVDSEIVDFTEKEVAG